MQFFSPFRGGYSILEMGGGGGGGGRGCNVFSLFMKFVGPPKRGWGPDPQDPPSPWDPPLPFQEIVVGNRPHCTTAVAAAAEQCTHCSFGK